MIQKPSRKDIFRLVLLAIDLVLMGISEIFWERISSSPFFNTPLRYVYYFILISPAIILVRSLLKDYPYLLNPWDAPENDDEIDEIDEIDDKD